MTLLRRMLALAKASMTRLDGLRVPEPVVVAALVLLAAATRLYDLGEESLWLDEATTFQRASLPLPELIADATKKYHNPTYFVLIHYWIALGDSEFMLRLPSALFGILQVSVVYVLGKIAAGRWVGFGAALVVCFNTKAVHYSQEARMYALYCLAASVAIAGLVWLLAHPAEAAGRLFRSDGATRSARRAWIAFVGGAIVSLYCHATAVLFVIACSAAALLFLLTKRAERRGFFWNWVIANVIVLVVFAPWIPSLFGQTDAMAEKGFWLDEPTTRNVWSSIRQVFTYRSGWLSSLVVAFALLGTFALRGRPLVLSALWLLTLLGPALLWLVSLRQPVFLPRLFLWSVAPFAVIVGAGMVVLRPVLLKVVCLSVFVALGGYWLNRSYYAPRLKPDWYDAIKLVSDRLKSGEQVIAIARRERRLLYYYFEREWRPIKRFDYDEVTGASDDKVDALVGDARAVWTIQGRNWATAEKFRSKLAARGRRSLLRHFGGGIMVERYSLRSERKRDK